MARVKEAYFPLDWDAIEACPDLERVGMVLNNLPDEALMRALEGRVMGRPDAVGVRAKWNILLSGRILGHVTVQSMLRELQRNPTLRRIVGLNPMAGPAGVPDKDEMSRFWKKLVESRRAEVEELREETVRKLRVHLPDLGRQLGTDTTALETWARGRREPKSSADPDADWGRKTRRWTDAQGGAHEDVTKWFGYKAHLVVDTRHELPLAGRVTKASRPDNEYVMEMVGELKGLGLSPETLSGDKAYDGGPQTEALWSEYRVRAVFDLRDTAQDGEDGTRLEGARNILLGNDGRVYCFARNRGKTIKQAMAPWGFEKDRGALKFRCPAAVARMECPERERCGRGSYGRVVRVKNHLDWRRFGTMARGSRQWKRLYSARTACERVNARLKTGLGLADLRVRGLKNVQMTVSLAILAMYGLALGHLRRGAKEWRSWTRVAR